MFERQPHMQLTVNQIIERRRAGNPQEEDMDQLLAIADKADKRAERYRQSFIEMASRATDSRARLAYLHSDSGIAAIQEEMNAGRSLKVALAIVDERQRRKLVLAAVQATRNQS